MAGNKNISIDTKILKIDELVVQRTLFFYTKLLIWHILLVKCLISALKWHNLQRYWIIFKVFESIDIYLFLAIRLCKKNCPFYIIWCPIFTFHGQKWHYFFKISSTYNWKSQNSLQDGLIGFYETPFWIPYGMY